MARCNCPRCPKCKEGRCDCDCKPASAPPAAALQALRRIVAVMGPTAPPCCEGCEWEWTEGLRIANEALAASAQVREGESRIYGDVTGTYADTSNTFKPAPEPVLVAQDVRRMIQQLRNDGEDAAADLIEKQHEILYGYGDARGTVWYEQYKKLSEGAGKLMDRATQAEASLAACRADAERLDFLESTGWPGQFAADPTREPDRRWFDCETTGSDYSPTLRAAIDAARSQP